MTGVHRTVRSAARRRQLGQQAIPGHGRITNADGRPGGTGQAAGPNTHKDATVRQPMPLVLRLKRTMQAVDRAWPG